ncbi:MAG: hypothetical protein M3O71_07290 [Bacteroidota bacterium]|nr:hypothetical protein [Bacteroidota bacterium]
MGNCRPSTVAAIAEKHLTVKGKDLVGNVLKGQTMEDVASWADEVRSTPQYLQQLHGIM